jgi:hypothetical protein
MDMEGLLRLMATLAIVSCALPAHRARVVLRETTLLEARLWGIVALSAWCATWLVTELIPIVQSGPADQLWMASAVLMVSPFVAALGARRPGSRVWSWFIVLPLTIVLFLPAVTAWNGDLHPTPLRLEAPMWAGYGLVLVMGTGNYLGTRFSLSALLAAAACLMVILPMSSLSSRLPFHLAKAHAAATIGLSAGVWLAEWQSNRSKPVPGPPFGRLWSDVRDFFGVVWARRLVERVNDVARKEDWQVRLHFDGFAANEADKPVELSREQLARIEQLLRWLLRRFVDPAWIDGRIAGREIRAVGEEESRPGGDRSSEPSATGGHSPLID